MNINYFLIWLVLHSSHGDGLSVWNLLCHTNARLTIPLSNHGNGLSLVWVMLCIVRCTCNKPEYKLLPDKTCITFVAWKRLLTCVKSPMSYKISFTSKTLIIFLVLMKFISCGRCLMYYYICVDILSPLLQV